MEEGNGNHNMRSPSTIWLYFRKEKIASSASQNTIYSKEWECHCIPCEQAGHRSVYFITKCGGFGTLRKHLKKNHGIIFH